MFLPVLPQSLIDNIISKVKEKFPDLDDDTLNVIITIHTEMVKEYLEELLYKDTK